MKLIYCNKINALQHCPWPGDFQAVLHVGDIAYDLRQDAGRIGDEFLGGMQPVAAAVPYMVRPRKHDRYSKYLIRNRRCIVEPAGSSDSVTDVTKSSKYIISQSQT